MTGLLPLPGPHGGSWRALGHRAPGCSGRGLEMMGGAGSGGQGLDGWAGPVVVGGAEEHTAPPEGQNSHRSGRKGRRPAPRQRCAKSFCSFPFLWVLNLQSTIQLLCRHGEPDPGGAQASLPVHGTGSCGAPWVTGLINRLTGISQLASREATPRFPFSHFWSSST